MLVLWSQFLLCAQKLHVCVCIFAHMYIHVCACVSYLLCLGAQTGLVRICPLTRWWVPVGCQAQYQGTRPLMKPLAF